MDDVTVVCAWANSCPLVIGSARRRVASGEQERPQPISIDLTRRYCLRCHHLNDAVRCS